MLIYNNGSNVSENLQEALERIKAARETQNQNLKANTQQSSVSTGTTSVNASQNYYDNVDSESNKTNTTDNVFVRSLGTITDTFDNIRRGVFGSFEGIIDTIIYGAGQVGSWFGADTKWAEEAIKFDITDKIIKYSPASIENLIYKASKGDMGATISDESYVQEANAKTQELIQGIEQGIGSSLAAFAGYQIGTTAFGKGTKLARLTSDVMFGTGAGGQSINEALQDGASYNQAGAYGVVSGVTEAAVEHLSDLFGVGTLPGQLSKSFVSKLANKQVGAVVGELTKAFVSEGLEEVASDILNPLYKSIYNGKSVEDNYKDFMEDVKNGSLITTFIVGGVSGVIMDTASSVYQKTYFSKEGIKIREQMQDVMERTKEAYNEYQNAPQTTLEEANIAKENYDNTMKPIKEEMSKIGEEIKKLDEKYRLRLEADELSTKYATSFSANSLQIEDINNIVERDLSKSLGKQYKVEYVEDNNKFNGKINKEKGVVYLSNNPQKAYRQVIAHEISHAFESSKGYESIANEVIDYLKAKDSVAFEKQVQDLKNNGYKSSEINNEIVADYVANNLTKSYK